MGQTLIIIKPDAVQRKLIGKIISIFQKEGFSIKKYGIIPRNVDVKFWNLFYAEHKEKCFFNNILEYITSGLSVAIVLEHNSKDEDVVQMVRDLMGPLPPNAPTGTIRGDYALDYRRNAIHGSDSVSSFNREIEICEKFDIF